MCVCPPQLARCKLIPGQSSCIEGMMSEANKACLYWMGLPVKSLTTAKINFGHLCSYLSFIPISSFLFTIFSCLCWRRKTNIAYQGLSPWCTPTTPTCPLVNNSIIPAPFPAFLGTRLSQWLIIVIWNTFMSFIGPSSAWILSLWRSCTETEKKHKHTHRDTCSYDNSTQCLHNHAFIYIVWYITIKVCNLGTIHVQSLWFSCWKQVTSARATKCKYYVSFSFWPHSVFCFND